MSVRGRYGLRGGVLAALCAVGLLSACGGGSLPGRSAESLTRATSLAVGPGALTPQPAARRLAPFEAALPRAEPAYSNTTLHRNFMSIALNAEAADDVNAYGGITISKWEGPIRYRLDGATPRDRLQISALANHLTSLTGLPIVEASAGQRHNMDIRFVPRQYRALAVDELGKRGLLGRSVGALAVSWRDYERDRCFTLTTRNARTGVTGTAHIFIKDELSPIWRETCIVEEMAQSLGLLNDDRYANPSIFNDDGVYLALTSHDELLLRTLYDPRIRSGMDAPSVNGLSRRIIDELRPGGANGA